MTPTEAGAVMESLDSRFPHSKLTDDNRADLMLRIKAIDGVSVEQAVAAIAEYSVESRRATPVMGDVLDAVRRCKGVARGDSEPLNVVQDTLRKLLRTRTEAFKQLAARAQVECECPAHYPDAPDCYVLWPVSARWMHARLSEVSHIENEPKRIVR